MKTAVQKTFWLLCLIAWMSLMFYLSSVPGLSSGLSWDYVLRKIAHAGEYAVLTFLFYQNEKSWLDKLTMTKKLLLAFFLTIAYAASDEIHQYFVPNRHGTPIDLIYDGVGSLVMIWLISVWPRLRSYFLKGTK